MAEVKETKVDQLIPDDHNFNKGTEFGQHLMEKSFRQFGAGRSILLDKNNRVIAGNKSLQTAAEIGLEDVIVVETTGEQIVAVKRTDIDLDTKQGRELALADNATSKANLDFNLPEIDSITKELDINPADWGIDLEGIELQLGEDEQEDDGEHGKLTDRFIVPPFSVLDTRQGYWQDRKRMWLEKTGNLSETRDGEFGTLGGTENMLAQINGGTSNFDPVLAEIIMSWFCPAGGKLLDPFGGEQTKGVVAGELGINYHAVEFRQEQVDLNREKTARYKGVHYTCGDSNNITNLISERGFDLCFTSPPYYDL